MERPLSGPDGRFGEDAISLIAPDNPIGLNRRSRFGADDVPDIGRIHVPINRHVLIQLSSKDVIHSFGVPAMRLKRDAVPGLIAPVWFTPTIAGEYKIACSQLCGLAHYRMRGTIIVESDAAFRAFLERESASQR